MATSTTRWLLPALLLLAAAGPGGALPPFLQAASNSADAISSKGRVHIASHFLGDVAGIPCDLDFAACGNIYFLTWSKNVSGEWQRVYLYSESYQTALGDFAFGGGSRVSLDASNMTTMGVAWLKVKQVGIDDEGMYKCDVTYVHGKCPSLTYTNLFTVVTPGPPVIRINGRDLNEFKAPPSSANIGAQVMSGEGGEIAIPTSRPPITIGPFEESSTMVIDCTTHGGRPAPEVRIYNGSRPLRAKVTSTAKSVTATVRFIITRYDLGARFVCVVENNATEVPLTNALVLDVHVKPLALRVRGPSQPVVAGEMITLTCSVEGARPAATIDWFNRSEIVTPHPPSMTDLMTDGTYRTTSTLVFIASRYEHKRDFFCMGTNQLLKAKHEVPLLEPATIRVLYPPAVRLEPSGRVAVNESDTLTIRCAFDANPPNVSEVVWYQGGRPLNGPGHNRQSQSNGSSGPRKPFLSYDNGLPTLSIANVTRNDSASYSCHLKNSFGRGNSTQDAFIDVYYPPVVSISIQPKLVVETRRPTVTLSCLVHDGNPRQLSRVTWFRNGAYLDTTLAATLTIDNASRADAGNYTCQGYNGAARPSTISTAKELFVQYPPSKAVLTFVTFESTLPADSTDLRTDPSGQRSAYAAKGSRAALRCSLSTDDGPEGDPGRPAFDRYVWHKDGVKLDTVDGPVLSIPSVSVSAQGNYSCAAANTVAVGPAGRIRLLAKAAPKLLRGLPVHGGALKNTSVTLFCRVECAPICKIEWFRNNQTLGFGYASIDAQTHPDSEPMSGVAQQKLSIRSRRDSAAAGSSGSSIFSFRRQPSSWPPFGSSYQDQQLVGADQQADGGTSGDHFVIKSVTHDQEFKADLLTSVTSYLHIRSGAPVMDSDVFSCASADQSGLAGGVQPAPVTSSTVYRMENAPENVHLSSKYLELNEGDPLTSDQVITCQALSRPAANYVWRESGTNRIVSRGPRLTFSVEDVDEHTAMSKSGLKASRAQRGWNGNYTCVASNKHGQSQASVTVSVFYAPECVVRRRTIGLEGRTMLACESTAHPSVYNFTWYKNNRTLTEVSATKREQQAAYMESTIVGDHGSTAATISTGGDTQTAVLVLVDGELDAYSCVAANSVGTSRPCKLADQSVTASSSGWAQLLLNDENILIAAAAAGGVLFIAGSGLLVAGVVAFRRRLKDGAVPIALRRPPGSLGLDGLHGHHLVGGHHPLHQQRYTNDRHYGLLDAALAQKQAMSSLLDERPIPDGMMTIVADCEPHSPIKSPLIRAGHGLHTLVRGSGVAHTESPTVLTKPGIGVSENCVDSDRGYSPLSGESDNGRGSPPSPAEHLYERPSSLYGSSGGNLYGRTAGGRPSQRFLPPGGADPSSYHQLNIPITGGRGTLGRGLDTQLRHHHQQAHQYQVTPHYARPPTQAELEQLQQLTLPYRGHQQGRSHRYQLDFE